MISLQSAMRAGAASALLFATAACSSTGGLGEILSGVLGGGGGSQVSGSIQGVNTQSRQISIQQTNGQSVTLTYDNNTQVIYQNQRYPVTSLEFGDQVTARIASGSGNSRYTDQIDVRQSVSGATGGQSGNVQTFEGTVRSVDRTNGLFGLNTNNSGTLTITMPYNPRQNDITRFQNLRSGDYVRLYGVLVNNSRVELRQFY